MRVERPSAKYPGQIDLYTGCDNPACEREKYQGYTAPWCAYASNGSGIFGEPDGWLSVGFDVNACSWACLAVVAAMKAEGVPA